MSFNFLTLFLIMDIGCSRPDDVRDDEKLCLNKKKIVAVQQPHKRNSKKKRNKKIRVPIYVYLLKAQINLEWHNRRVAEASSFFTVILYAKPFQRPG